MLVLLLGRLRPQLRRSTDPCEESTLRFLVVHPGPAWSVADVYQGWVEALTDLGQQVSTFNLDSRLTLWTRAMVETGQVEGGVATLRRAVDDKTAIHLASDGILSAAYKCWPEVVLVVSCMFVSTEQLDILRWRGARVVLVHTESPYDDDNQMELAAHADLNLINDPTNLEQFRAISPTEYVSHCYRPTIHYPGPPSPGMTSDFCFVGTSFPSRVEFLEKMDLDHSGMDVLLAGQWQTLEPDSPLRKWLAHDGEGLDNDQTAQIYRSAKTSLNLYRREAARPELAEGWSMGPREVEMAACGLFFVRDPRGEGDELLSFLPRFGSPQEAADQLRHYLRHDHERQKLAVRAMEAVADRTFDRSARRLLALLDR